MCETYVIKANKYIIEGNRALIEEREEKEKKKKQEILFCQKEQKNEI